ncbi:rhodanese-like domain-containing protein [Dyadobacter sp. LHD-138]|uniref:rhodanese-like domain-containing protein n=1 Tax=Dyadobacter sp. LHD-138 TaxID=3071413 RepID=UPI0027DF7F63|nr:rhodanese-like domain-containing protein [Dyadobacter sp. LHD-138]MDQ6481068.1 rhodanese-like domain-containing protein [Dyadobacter sp. LHD-138]
MKRVLLSIALLCALSLSVLAQNKSNVKADEFDKKIGHKGVQLLDVRRPAEYEEGHIKGSTLTNWEDKASFEEHTRHLDRDKPVYVYCRSGKRSSDAATFLSEQGFKNVVNLEGGILGWKQEGKQVETGSESQGAASVSKH